MAKPAPTDSKQASVGLFLNNIFFFVLYFLILVMIASFGIIAEV
ncbi:MAG: hypothetical protein U0003_03160 [Vampirovibrionales bacterium]